MQETNRLTDNADVEKTDITDENIYKGRIIKGIAGFYYVYSKGTIYECKAKGIFRNRKVKPLVGDDVEIKIIDTETHTGNIERILDRKSELIRPAVANIDQALVVFAAASPSPNFNLLDRFLIMMKRQNINTVICFNKVDLVDESVCLNYYEMYDKAGYAVVFSSTLSNDGIDDIKAILNGRTTTLAGPSGVGKSSIMNMLNPAANMDTGEISRKIERGKHTTRHSELIPISDDTFLMDTPGFSNISLFEMEAEELKDYYFEFEQYEPYCRFGGCNHIGEKDCGVKDAVDNGEIADSRYDNYKLLYEELKNKKRY